MGTLYSSATGKRSVLTASPISPYIDGYVLTEGFDEACVDGTLADVPYMIGYTLNDAGNMEPVITDFCLNREEAFHSSDLWFVFKSLKNCWRPWTQGDWDLSEKMLTAWSNFAKYSDPNGKDGGDWKPVTAAQKDFMVFCLDENDQEASFLGEPKKAPRPSFRP